MAGKCISSLNRRDFVFKSAPRRHMHSPAAVPIPAEGETFQSSRAGGKMEGVSLPSACLLAGWLASSFSSFVVLNGV